MLIFDIEADGLLDTITKLHVISAQCTETQERFHFDKEECHRGVELLEKASGLAGHNVIGYDIPAIKKLYPQWKCPEFVRDTMIMSQLAWSDIKDKDYGRARKGQLPSNLIGRHSLAAYGYRLGVLKGNFGDTTDWQEWSQEMSDYCRRDVDVTVALWNRLMKKNLPEDAVELEHQVQWIIQRQIRFGINFDVKKAHELYARLIDHEARIRGPLQEMVPDWVERDGKKEFVPKKNNRKMGYIEGCPLSKIKYKQFNPGSRTHVIRFLKTHYGWEPKEFTDSGLPKLDDEILGELPYPEAQKLSEFFMVRKRLGQLSDGKESWLNHVTPEGKIHGGVSTCGAISFRMTHQNPNLSQVPACGKPYGRECRELFGPPPGYVQLGFDITSLEGATLAHFTTPFDGGEFAKILMEGDKDKGTDLHTLNSNILGIGRDESKTFFFSFIYGCGDDLLAENAGRKGAAEGKKLRKIFLDRTPGLKGLKEALDKRVKERGHLLGLDKRCLMSRSSHSRVNLVCQSAGGLLAKKALAILEKKLQAAGYKNSEQTEDFDFEFLLNVHDEWQMAVKEELAPIIGQMSIDATGEAAEAMNFRIKLSGEYKVGSNWAETH